jgi:hypothetical protein
MPGRVFFRDGCATVTSAGLSVGERVYPLAEILAARCVRRRSFLFPWPLRRFALVITTSTGDWEVLRHRNAYVIFQLAKAVETALRDARQKWAQSA